MTERWRNCGGVPDAETQMLDREEMGLSPLPAHVHRTRELITGLEMCHHKAERWVARIIEAVRTGEPSGGLGSRGEGELHPAERVWQSACEVIAAWIDGNAEGIPELRVGDKTGAELIAALGEPTALKQWQAGRVLARIRSFIGWPHSTTHRYVQLAEGGAEGATCPVEYREAREFWRETLQTVLRDVPPAEMPDAMLYIGGAELSLAVAIDVLMPCNWNFVENLYTLLAAIGGERELVAPYAACARHVRRAPLRSAMISLCEKLRSYDQVGEHDVARELGEPTPERRWLVASLEKTIRLQLEIPRSA